MPSEVQGYFSQAAQGWTSIEEGCFGEGVREAAIAKAYLRSDMQIAAVGAGRGYLAAGLAPLAHQVYLIDGSEANLKAARQNLKGFKNLVLQKSEGLVIPLPDTSLDVVFANMVLQHCPDPLAAIRELTRLLRPGGRLVMIDMDSHPHEWDKGEMTDVVQGFDPVQIRCWFQEAELVNVIVDAPRQSFEAEPQDGVAALEETCQAQANIFVAVGARRLAGIQEEVSKHYGGLAEGGANCCSADQAGAGRCCDEGELISFAEVSNNIFRTGYSSEEKAAAPVDAANFSLGCGNPVAIANLKIGETVLDIGSGGGLDAFLSARKVGPNGKVIGVDMTLAMLERARRSAEKVGLANVEFRQGQAEALPMEDGSVDVILSNCVINLCEDKGAVFREAHRALRPGGRLEISDMVTEGAFSSEYRSNPANWGGCVFGALPEGEYLSLLSQAGFKDIQVRRSDAARWVDGVKIYSITVSADRI